MKDITITLSDQDEADLALALRTDAPTIEELIRVDLLNVINRQAATDRKQRTEADVARVLAKDPAAGEALLALRKQKDEEFALEVKKEADKIPADVAAVEVDAKH